jgi:hypothetical protein
MICVRFRARKVCKQAEIWMTKGFWVTENLKLTAEGSTNVFHGSV